MEQSLAISATIIHWITVFIAKPWERILIFQTQTSEFMSSSHSGNNEVDFDPT